MRKNRRLLLQNFIRFMFDNNTSSVAELKKQFTVNEETFMKFLRWMEAGGFIEIFDNRVVVWKGEYQHCLEKDNWVFHSFNG